MTRLARGVARLLARAAHHFLAPTVPLEARSFYDGSWRQS